MFKYTYEDYSEIGNYEFTISKKENSCKQKLVVGLSVRPEQTDFGI